MDYFAPYLTLTRTSPIFWGCASRLGASAEPPLALVQVRAPLVADSH
jgi:hypothetical protein